MTGLVGLVETPTTGPDAPRFEVTSVKRNVREAQAGNPADVRGLAGGAFRATNATLRMLIRNAYRLGLTDEIVGGPPWIDSFGFDVDARPAKPSTLVESAYMTRTLLADRFKLAVRKETRDADAAKYKWPAPGQPGRRCGVGPDGDTQGRRRDNGHALVTVLSPMLDRPVVDRTGLTGAFDFDIRFDGATMMAVGPLGRGRGAAVAVSPDTPSDPAKGPSIFTALQEQLGLKLEAQRGGVDVLAVISAELPTEN